LLGVMDIRGQVRRLNYRTGPQCENVRCIVIASANDVELLKKMMSGALYSRFQNKVWCPRPDRKIMEKILKREIKEIEGDTEWIEPALSFGVDKWGMSDPRDLITILSCGGADLLSGDYQKDYEETMHPLERKQLLGDKAKKEAA
jgi:SpoVK/Ycf46/Vps4 family AAA+-type ATPase